MPAVDFVEIALEENPIYENAVAVPTTGPNRIATEKLYMAGPHRRRPANTQYKRRDDEFRGIPGTIPKLLDHYEPDGALSEYAYYDDLTWLLLALPASSASRRRAGRRRRPGHDDRDRRERAQLRDA
jgi:hypothetical protein